jgi:hypothetical protein
MRLIGGRFTDGKTRHICAFSYRLGDDATRDRKEWSDRRRLSYVVLLIIWHILVQIIWHTVASGAPRRFAGHPGAPDSGRTVPAPHILTLDLQSMRQIISTEVSHIMCKATCGDESERHLGSTEIGVNDSLWFIEWWLIWYRWLEIIDLD